MDDMSEGSLSLIFAVLAFFAGLITEFFLKILSRHYDEHRNRVFQKRVLRGDLGALWYVVSTPYKSLLSMR